MAAGQGRARVDVQVADARGQRAQRQRLLRRLSEKRHMRLQQRIALAVVDAAGQPQAADDGADRRARGWICREVSLMVLWSVASMRQRRRSLRSLVQPAAVAAGDAR